MKISKLANRYRVDKPHKFHLADWDPADTAGLDIEKDEAKVVLAEDVKRLAKLQERLYAQHDTALLVIFQAMDAAGKDSAIEHVMSGVNPQGCEVHAFKSPSVTELDHDFLWRTTVVLPRRGHIGIFNRSYYEEVLVARVHPEVLARQRLPARLVSKHIWSERFEDICAFERHLVRSGTHILKFYLHVSKAEQKRRFLDRLNDPNKQWKFEANDVAERARWSRYMAAYEDMIRHTSTDEAPWHVVPADNKWFTRLVVARALVDALEAIDPRFPKVDAEARAELKDARTALLREGRSSRKPAAK